MKDQVIPLVAIGNIRLFKRCTACSVYEEDEIIVSDNSWVRCIDGCDNNDSCVTWPYCVPS
jgi:hypothetical protein